MEIFEKLAENAGEITKTQFAGILNKYFEPEIKEEDLPEDLTTTTLTLKTKAEYGKYEIKIGEIYNGTLIGGQQGDEEINTQDLITEWTVQDNDILVLLIGTQYINDNNFVVDWGDGTEKETIDDTENILGENPSHQYKKAGTYRITISGKCLYFTLSSIYDARPEQTAKLTKIISWGEIQAKTIIK